MGRLNNFLFVAMLCLLGMSTTVMGAVIFSDDFEDGIIGSQDWMVIGNTWNEHDGVLETTSANPELLSCVLTNRTSFSNFTATFNLKIITTGFDHDIRHLWFRATADDVNGLTDGYSVQFRLHSSGERQLQLYRGIYGQGPVRIAEVRPYPFVTDSWYSVKVQAAYDNIRVKVWLSTEAEPNEWDIDVVDSTYSSGRIGFGNYMQSIAQFDNLTIANLRPQLFGGTIVTWGRDNYGQGANPPSGYDFKEIDAGGFWNLALKCDGSLVAWGDNNRNQCTNLPDGNDYIAIATPGAAGLAIKSDNSLVVWGSNDSGQLVPPDTNDIKDITGGGNHCLALKLDSTLFAWGKDDEDDRCNPPDGNDYIAIAAGACHNVAIKSDGTLVAWGANDYNQCDVPEGNDFCKIACGSGSYHTVALRTDGTLEAWGRNDSNQCNVPLGDDFVDIGCGAYHSFAIKENGTTEAWGNNDWGQRDVPSIPAGFKFIKIDGGSCHSIGLIGKDPTEVIIDFIIDSVEDGTLKPVKPGKPGEGQLNALISMLWTAHDLIDAELIEEACRQLSAALAKTDGLGPPAPDFVTGPAAEELAEMIQELMAELGCE